MLSSLQKKWVIQNTDQKQSLLQKLLKNRNLKTEEEIDRFLNPDMERDFHDPFLMIDMKKAVERIKKAVKNKERIIIFGDYDVDGITGSAILVRTLQKLGAPVSYRLPHRMDDGYGLREKFIPEFHKAGVKLVITVDNGISCRHEVAVAAKHGIDVIITDHHTIPEKLPDAFAILHPGLPKTRYPQGNGFSVRYPFKGLTGAGVAFKLAKALILTCLPTVQHGQLIQALLDLACMGTIADLGPLRGENRAIVKFGLQQLAQTRWPGLSRLKHHAGVDGKMDTHTVGFMLGPRINAAGRMSHPYYSLQLLLDNGKKSDQLAGHLEQLNKKRQALMGQCFNEASILAQEEIQNGTEILVLSHTGWKSGIVGLIAAKLTERFGRPAFVMEDRGNMLVGSARSIFGFNVVAAVTHAKKHLRNFGGHEMAAGFELDKKNLKGFKKSLYAYAKKYLHSGSLTPVLSLECELNPEEISFETAAMIAEFEPFGVENETPRFIVRNICPENIQLVGREKKHLKFDGRLNDKLFPCIGFNLGHLAEKISTSSPGDLACELMTEEWKGRKKLTLKVLDFRQ